MENRDRQVVSKILSEIEVISELIHDIDFIEFGKDEKTKRAVCMTLINIGELVKTLSDDFKLSHAEIPWRAISGLRDVAAHRYQTLRMEDIWATVKTDIPILYEKINSLIIM